MRSIRFTVLSNARKYVTERVVKNGRNDLFSVSLVWGELKKKLIYQYQNFILAPYTRTAITRTAAAHIRTIPVCSKQAEASPENAYLAA